MIIRDIETTVKNARARISAKVSWENCSYSDREIYFETDASFVDSLSPDPNAFLLAGIIPAMRFGERRILVEGHLCPQLRDGLDIAVRQLRKWYGGNRDQISIEAIDGFEPSSLPSNRRTACCMSGGVDSLATFRRNRLNFPLDHPGAVKDLLFIHGFDLGANVKYSSNFERYSSACKMLSEFADEQNAQLLPIYTNIRVLEEDAPGTFYTDLFVLQSFAACLAACAHAFSNRLTSLLIPSSHDVMDLQPLGSHPLLDPNYSSASLAILHDGLAYSRIDKMHLLKEWAEGLRVLRVCADPLRTDLKMNCGFCEKCIRAKISLLALGILDQCPTFEENDVTADDIDLLWISAPKPGSSAFGYMSYGSHHFWEMMLEPVRVIGRSDLVGAIERKITEYRRFLAGSSWTGRIKFYDQQLLGGTIRKTIRGLRGRANR